jgi:AraC family transcriptional regulator
MEMRVENLAAGQGWRVQDLVCSAGPQDQRYEEQHPAICIAAVMQGSFQYRTTRGAATLAPGAILLGNQGHCFECGHDHATGDRCVSFMFEPAYFATILSATPHVRSEDFAIASLPPLMALAPAVTAAELACTNSDSQRWEEISLGLAGAVVGLLADPPRTQSTPSSRDQQRIAAALRRIQAEAHLILSLTDLANDAGMSRYHFLRTFRRVIGLTPHQYILRTRLRTAAIELRQSARPILDIALDAGFADLSTFNRRFHATMGATPGTYRRRR